MALDKVELCGRNINVGRPKGYIEPPQVISCHYSLPGLFALIGPIGLLTVMSHMVCVVSMT